MVVQPPGHLAQRRPELVAESAWVPFLADLVDGFVGPAFVVFMLALVAFEVGVGVLILSRGSLVDLGIGASVLWVLALLPFLPPCPMGVTNLALAALQGVLLARRYDRSIWELARQAFGRGADRRAESGR